MKRAELESMLSDIQKRYNDISDERLRLEGEFRRVQVLLENHKGDNVNPQDQPVQNPVDPVSQAPVEPQEVAQAVPGVPPAVPAENAQAPAEEPVEAPEAQPESNGEEEVNQAVDAQTQSSEG